MQKNKIRIKSVLHWKNWLNTIESMYVSNSFFFFSLIMIWSLFKKETEKEEKKYLENIFTQFIISIANNERRKISPKKKRMQLLSSSQYKFYSELPAMAILWKWEASAIRCLIVAISQESITWPASMVKIRSHLLVGDRIGSNLCTIVIMVRLWASMLSVDIIRFSVSTSTEAVASSNIRMGEFLTKALAKQSSANLKVSKRPLA